MAKARRKPRREDPNRYPKGWNARRVAAIISYYDKHRDDEMDVIGAKRVRSTPKKSRVPTVWVEVPEEILPEVKKIIARHRQSTSRNRVRANQ